MPTTHEAAASWQGDLASGKGTVSLKSAAMKQAPTTWKERTEGTGTENATSPEELLAAAHASCFSMALAARIAKAAAPATKLEVIGKVTFGPVPSGGNGVASSALSVRASAPGLTAEKLRELAEDAMENCPLSKALKGNVALSVDSALVR